MAVSLCGESVIDWKVDCDNYLPDSNSVFNLEEYLELLFTKDSVILDGGKEIICVLPKDKYRVYHGVCSCAKNWADTIAVTK